MGIKKIFKTFLKILFFVLLISFAISLILFGLYYANISRKQYAFGLLVDQVFEKVEEVFMIDSKYYFDDSFQVEGTLKMDFSSEDYQNKSVTDIEYVKKNNKLQNLSLMDSTYIFKHDKKNRKFSFQFHEAIGEEEIFDGKYLIDNSTKYYFVNGVLENYVNDGSNNYFESYKEDIHVSDNISYLYHFIRDSIKKNITEEDLMGYDVETLVGDGTIKAGQVSFRITDKNYKTLLKAILRDLKKDERANQILSLIYPNINELKVNDKIKYLKSNESYTINVYVSKPFFVPVKYEVVYIKGDQKKIYTYEGNKNEGIFYYSVNNELKYRATVQGNSKKMDVLVYNQNGSEVGTIKLEKDRDNLLFTMTLGLEDNKYDITYGDKFKNYQNNGYTRENSLNFKIMNQKVVLLQGNVLFDSHVRKNAKIEEDLSSSVLESTLSEEESRELKTLRDKIKERLES